MSRTAVKQRNMKPDPDSVMPDETQKVEGGGWDGEKKAKLLGGGGEKKSEEWNLMEAARGIQCHRAQHLRTWQSGASWRSRARGCSTYCPWMFLAGSRKACEKSSPRCSPK